MTRPHTYQPTINKLPKELAKVLCAYNIPSESHNSLLMEVYRIINEKFFYQRSKRNAIHELYRQIKFQCERFKIEPNPVEKPRVTRKEIIEIIFKDKEYKQVCMTVAKGSDLGNDLYQEFFFIVNDLKTPLLQSLHEAGTLKRYLVRILYIQYTGTNTKFNKLHKYTTSDIELMEIADNSEAYDPEIDKLFDKAQDKLDSIYDYDSEIFKAYIREKGIRRTAKAIGIPASSVCKTVKKTKEKLIKHLR